MRILEISNEPIESIPFKTLAPGGNSVIDAQLPILTGKIHSLPDQLQAIVVASDLQGIFKNNQSEKLLGEEAASLLSIYISTELRLDPQKIGVILCGDLFANLEKRGGLGDVRAVWNSFRNNFKWVVGVCENHDTFGNNKEFEAFKNQKCIYYIDKEMLEVDNIKIAGIGGIIGNTNKINRLDEAEFKSILEKVLLKKPDILILHECPNSPTENLRGNESIRNILEASYPVLVFCGHKHWKKPVTTLSNQTQVLNSDRRVVLLTKQYY